jgi:hypothetical protein
LASHSARSSTLDRPDEVLETEGARLAPSWSGAPRWVGGAGLGSDIVSNWRGNDWEFRRRLHLEFILVITVDARILIGAVFILPWVRLTQNPQAAPVLVLQNVLEEVMDTTGARALTSFKELEVFFVFSFTFSLTARICMFARGSQQNVMGHLTSPGS